MTKNIYDENSNTMFYLPKKIFQRILKILDIDETQIYHVSLNNTSELIAEVVDISEEYDTQTYLMLHPMRTITFYEDLEEIRNDSQIKKTALTKWNPLARYSCLTLKSTDILSMDEMSTDAIKTFVYKIFLDKEEYFTLHDNIEIAEEYISISEEIDDIIEKRLERSKNFQEKLKSRAKTNQSDSKSHKQFKNKKYDTLTVSGNIIDISSLFSNKKIP